MLQNAIIKNVNDTEIEHYKNPVNNTFKVSAAGDDTIPTIIHSLYKKYEEIFERFTAR